MAPPRTAELDETGKRAETAEIVRFLLERVGTAPTDGELSVSAMDHPGGGRGPRAQIEVVGGRRVAASQGESTLKVRTLLVAGAAAVAVLVPALAAHAAGPVTTCATSAPSVLAGATTAPTPDGGTIFAQGLATSGGSIGITGPGGYLYASGNTSGGSIQGTTASGGSIPWLSNTSNGYLKVGSSPSLCFQAGGHGVSAP